MQLNGDCIGIILGHLMTNIKYWAGKAVVISKHLQLWSFN